MTYAGVPTGLSQSIIWNGTTFISGNARAFPQQINTSAPAGWFNAYEVDWMTLPTASYTSNGLTTINGVSWDVINSASASYIALSGTNKGLEIRVIGTGNNDIFSTTRTAPALVLPLKNIASISSSYFDPTLYDLRIVTQCSASNHNLNYEHCGMSYELSAANATAMTFAKIGHVFHSTFGTQTIYTGKGFNGTSVDGPTLNLATENIFIATITDPFGITFSISSSLTPSASFDPINMVHRQMAKYWWTTYAFTNGVVSSSTYRDYNVLLFAAAPAAATRDVIGNFYRTYVQVRSKTIGNISSPYFVTSSFNLNNLNRFITISASNIVTMSLPTIALNGQTHLFKDVGGNAATNIIVVSSSNKQIDNAATASITTNYGSLEVVYMSSSTRDAWGII